jgi:hypothetical protein
MIGRLLCLLGFHRSGVIDDGHELSDGCERAGCGWRGWPTL